MLEAYIASVSVSVPIVVLTPQTIDSWLLSRSEIEQSWVKSNSFSPEKGSLLTMSDAQGAVSLVLLGVKSEGDLWGVARLPQSLCGDAYHFEPVAALAASRSYELACIAWTLGAYSFNQYKSDSEGCSRPQLVISDESLLLAIQHWDASFKTAQDLANQPFNKLTPAVLADFVKQAAASWGASVSILDHPKKLRAECPGLAAVGQGSPYPPCLIDLRWGKKDHPKLTLVGKGVCFDTGGVDLKSAVGMRTMKKDMSGAAHVLGLAQRIILAKLPVQLRVLIPAADNAVSGEAYRPGDIITMRSGCTVEIHNTDAEGRMVLADALTMALEEEPDLLIDIATLTGAASVALGEEVPAFYTHHDDVADGLMQHSKEQADPLWRMPLHASYMSMLSSGIADCVNATSTGQAGSVTAALFLDKFVGKRVPWVHIDGSAWRSMGRPGLPAGPRVMALRAVFSYLEQRYRMSSQ